MPKKKLENQFTIRLAHLGQDCAWGDYSVQKDKRALPLITKSVINIADKMVGAENRNYALLMVGLRLLSYVHKRYDELFPDFPKEKLEEIFENELILEEKSDG